MLSRFKSLITDIKSDINVKIELIEVDTKKIRIKSTRTIDQKLSFNGIDFLKKKDEIHELIEQNGKQNEKKIEDVIELFKECIHRTSLKKISYETFKKDYSELCHSIKLVKRTLERVESFCKELNNELDNLEDDYDEKNHKLTLNEMQTEYDTYCAEKIKEYEIRRIEKEKKETATKKLNSEDPLDNLLENENEGLKLGKLSMTSD